MIDIPSMNYKMINKMINLENLKSSTLLKEKRTANHWICYPFQPTHIIVTSFYQQ